MMQYFKKTKGLSNMRKLKIFFDIDGVLANTQKEIINRYNSEYGLNYTVENITCWDLSKVQKPGTDMSKYFTEPGFFASLEPIEGAQEVVKILSDIGDELFVATASPVEGLSDKVLWIQKHYPEIPVENICLITRKDMLWGDVILDDGIHNLVASKFSYPIVFNQPWNREGGEDLIRAYSWQHFLKLVQMIRNGVTYEQLLRVCQKVV